jgi:c-di-GMP-binding flagellar brake protein YcgR
MLSGFSRENEQFSVVYNRGTEMFLSTLVAVDSKNGRLIFDYSGSIETNKGVLASEQLVFVGRPGGITVQFTCGQATEIMYEGSKAFSAPMPKLIIRMQRREFFRISTPRIRPLMFFGRLPDGTLLNLPAHDISVAGIGLDAATLPDGLEFGLVLSNCRLTLPDDSNDLFFSAALRHLRDHEVRSGVHQWRIGLQFNNMSGADESRVQRYIAKLERERNDLR